MSPFEDLIQFQLLSDGYAIIYEKKMPLTEKNNMHTIVILIISLMLYTSCHKRSNDIFVTKAY